MRKQNLPADILSLKPTLSYKTELTPLWTAIVGGIAAVAATVAPIWYKHRQEKQERKDKEEKEKSTLTHLEEYKGGFNDQIICYELLNSMLRDGAHRAVVWRGTDDRGIPAVGKPYTVSPMQAVTRYNTENVILSYVNIPVDQAYIEMLLKSMEAPLTVVVNDPETMPKGLLRDFYIAEEITYAILIGLTLDEEDNSYNYISVATHEGKSTPQQITQFQVTSNAILQLILRAKKARK